MFESRPSGPKSGPSQSHLWAHVSGHSRAAARRPRPGPGPLRLTRRGGQVLVGFVLTLILVAVAAGIPPAGSAAGATTNLTTTQRQAYDVWHAHVVAPGETLWDLAVRFAPDTDPRETVLRLQQVNQLPSTLLPAGRLVLVPAVSAVGSPPESRR